MKSATNTDKYSEQHTKKTTTLLSLPAELRLRIYETIFPARSFWIVLLNLNISNQVYLERSHIADSRLLTPLVISNRLMHEEITSMLYGQANVDINVHDAYSLTIGRCIGAIEKISLWPHLRKVNLHIRFTSQGDHRVLVARLSVLIRTLEDGKNLTSLMVRIIWRDEDPIPEGMDEVVTELECLRFNGSLRVIVDGSLDDDELDQVSGAIYRRIMNHADASLDRVRG